jgi:uncharacterized protein involved in copper resistance
MDDAAIFWRVDAMAERRFHDRAPAWEWKAKAWIGDDYNELRLENSGRTDLEAALPGRAEDLVLTLRVSAGCGREP